MTAMSHATKLIIVNSCMVAGLAIEAARGAPWLAIAITGGIALPLANLLMVLKNRRSRLASNER